MECKKCGASLTYNNGLYICEFCGSKYLREEFIPDTKDSVIIVNGQSNVSEYVICGGVLVAYNGNKNQITLPDGVRVIGAGAFKNNVAINSVTFSSSIKTIEKNAFEGCVNLYEINGYEAVENYGDECFKFAGLKQVEIGGNVKTLGKYCFAYMPNLSLLIYKPHKDIKLNHTFAYCKNLSQVEMDKFYCFPSFHSFLQLQNNPGNKRYTYYDGFFGTPFFDSIKEELFSSYKQGICPECGGKIKKGLFHAKCKGCGIDYKN